VQKDDKIMETMAVLAPEVAYKYVNEQMPEYCWQAIDKCLRMEGSTPEILSQFLAEKMDIPDPIRRFFSRALEHRKWLLDLGVFD